MQIVNVVEIINGNLSSIESFPISILEEKYQVENAEKLFIKKVRENSTQLDIEDEELLDDAYWSDNSGYEVMISWSEVNL